MHRVEGGKHRVSGACVCVCMCVYVQVCEDCSAKEVQGVRTMLEVECIA